MANEALTILIGAVDKASSVLRGVGSTARAEAKGIADAASQAAAASATGWGRASSAIEQHAGAIRATGIAVSALGAGVLAVAASSIAAINEQEVAQTKLSSAIKGTGQAIDQAALEKLAGQLQKVTMFSDDATIEMMAMLASFNLNQRQIEQLAPRVQNIAALMGIDLHSAAVAVGKAIATGNVAALKRFGILIDDATAKSGDFVAILKAIDANTGPAAEALGKTAAGAAAIFKNQIGELQEAIGKALVPGLRAITPVATAVAEAMTAIASVPIVGALVGITVAAGALLLPLGMFITAVPSLVAGWNLLSGAQARNAAAARTAAAANAAAAAAAGAGGAAAAGGGLATGIGAAAAAGGGALPAIAPAVGAAAGRGLLGRIGGLARGAVGRLAIPAALAVGAYSVLRGKYERQLAADKTREAELAQPALGAWYDKSRAARSQADQQRAFLANVGAGALPAIAPAVGAAAGAQPYLGDLSLPSPLLGEGAGGEGRPAAASYPITPQAAATYSGRGPSQLSNLKSQMAGGVTVNTTEMPDGTIRLEVLIDRGYLPPGLLDDHSTAYLEDIAYAGAGS